MNNHEIWETCPDCYKEYDARMGHMCIPRSGSTFFGLFAGCAMLAIMPWFFVGCTTERKTNNWYAAHEPKRAEMCHILYPCQDSVHTEYRFVEGETQYVHGDTVVTVQYDTVTKTITKRLVRVDTFYKDKVVYQTDKAELSVLQAKYNELEDKADQIATQRDYAVKAGRKYRNWTFSLAAFIAAVAGTLYLTRKRWA